MEAQNQMGTGPPVLADLPIEVTSNSPTAAFYSDPGCLGFAGQAMGETDDGTSEVYGEAHSAWTLTSATALSATRGSSDAGTRVTVQGVQLLPCALPLALLGRDVPDRSAHDGKKKTGAVA